MTQREVRALENAISGVTLHHWGGQTHENGRIVNETGRTVFAAGLVAAIGKVLESLRSDPG